MKVLHITSNFLPNIGGVEIDLHNSLLSLRKANIDARLLVPLTKKRIFGYEGYTVYRFPKSRFYSDQAWMNFSLSSVYAIWKFDIIMCSSCSYEAFQAIKWREKTGKSVKIIAKTSGSDLNIIEDINYGMMTGETGKMVVREVLRKSDLIISNSSIMTLAAGRIDKEAVNKIVSVPNGCDIDSGAFDELDKNKCKNKLGFNENDFVITHVTRNSEVKNSGLFIEIAKALSEKDNSLRFIIAGKVHNKTNELIIKYGMNDIIFKTGEIKRYNEKGLKNPDEEKKYMEILRASDIGVFTSRIESFGNAPAEFGYLGIPLIINSNMGVKDLMTGIAENFVLENSDVNDYSEKIKELKNDKTLYSQYCSELKKLFSKIKFDSIISEYKKIFEYV